MSVQAVSEAGHWAVVVLHDLKGAKPTEEVTLLSEKERAEVVVVCGASSCVWVKKEQAAAELC